MSALQRQTYANATQPLYLSAGGDIVVNGQIESVGGPIAVVDGNGVVKAALGVNTTNAYVACQSGQRIYFGGYSGLPGQTYINPAASANQDSLVVGGSVSVQQLKLATGVDAAIGTATLVAGQAIVNTTACLGVNSFIFLTRTNLNASTALGDLRIQNKNVGQFTITSSTMSSPPPLSPETGDLSDVQWVIINPA